MAQSTRTLIIGSGVAGSLIAQEMLRKGHGPVVMLEAGPAVPMRDRRAWLDHVMNGRLPYTSLYDQPDDFSSSGVVPWQITGGRIIGRGGSTLHWGGWAPRFQPEDFRLKSNTNQGMDWPFDYAALEPYYCKAEQFLQVAGDSTPPPFRSQPYPFPPPPYPALAAPIIQSLQSFGYSFQHMPMARNTEPIAGRPACVTTGTCDYCPIGARFTGDQPLERLETDTRFTLQLHSAVRKILMSSRKQVTGVEYVDTRNGEVHTIEAEHVFICAGAIETPKLLLASANTYWDTGIGNGADLVGRYLVASPFLSSQAIASSNPNKLQAELNFPTLCTRQWDTASQQAQGKVLVTANYNTPFLNLGTLMNQGKTAEEMAAAATGSMKFELWGSLHEFSHAENRVQLGRETTRFGLPKTIIETPRATYDQQVAQGHLDNMKKILVQMGLTPVYEGIYPQRGDHAMGTTRMSASEADGVVTPDLRVHGVDNLYIASNSVFPSGAAANPTLTLVAVILKALESFPVN
ncbi:GMC oxidoreductase [Archangium lipolyticum]|uniref:GMC oxidoreductase n=1 Tax=Archangium lipolyticum TaxID=2970465 RepID=UPI00214A36A4|nr:GMC family oxidoreductase [Archangium lipolyticum]